MARLGSTITRLSALRAKGLATVDASPDHLSDLATFGSNPGALRARSYVPKNLPSGAPLVVILHGCTQSAAAYDRGAGWSQVADELGLALLLPEQQRANNANLCFNWFSPADSRRDMGEALSIRQMIAATVATHDIDPNRIFITGLSAGGAMTSVMLATYPELFAGGAIIAGLPYGCTTSVADAFSRMAGQGYPSEAQLASLVREASGHKGHWPAISVWQGTADATVHPSNADRIVEQWRLLHGVATEPSSLKHGRDHVRRSWSNSDGMTVIEQMTIIGMGHGTPLDTRGPDACGKPGPFMLEVGISSTRQIAAFWGVGNSSKHEPASQPPVQDPKFALQAVPTIHLPRPEIEPPTTTEPARSREPVRAIIEDALRAAGLMR